MTNEEYTVGTWVVVREEYRTNASLQGRHTGIIQQINRVGTVLVYTVALGGLRRTLTQGVLRRV